MSTATPLNPIPEIMTGEEYLAFERAAEFRHEFYEGTLVAMAGASERHNQVSLALSSLLFMAMRGHPCRVYAADMRVKPSPNQNYVYPDIFVACPPIEYSDDSHDTILNPQVVIEILSPSTASNDLYRKFDLYREAESLVQYVVVSQDEMRVRSFLRQTEGIAWTMVPLDQPDSVLEFPTLGVSISLTDIFQGVEFPKRTNELVSKS